jgi:hypothetical protein
MLRHIFALGAAAAVGAAIANDPKDDGSVAYHSVIEGRTARVTLLQTSATATYASFMIKDASQYAGYSPGFRVVALVEAMDPHEDANLSIGNWSVLGSEIKDAYAQQFIGDISAARGFGTAESVLNAPAPAIQGEGRRYIVDFHGLGQRVDTRTGEVTLRLGFGTQEEFRFSAVPMPW